jgi:hypothetical protein
MQRQDRRLYYILLHIHHIAYCSTINDIFEISLQMVYVSIPTVLRETVFAIYLDSREEISWRERKSLDLQIEKCQPYFNMRLESGLKYHS